MKKRILLLTIIIVPIVIVIGLLIAVLLLNRKPKYTITFNTNGGTSISSIKVEEGSMINNKISTTKEGYKFSGWYTDTNLTYLYNFSNPVYYDFTLYAKWEVEVSDVIINISFYHPIWLT
jgi:uncharacterized repeat protein (TIGR02543 family)